MPIRKNKRNANKPAKGRKTENERRKLSGIN